MSTTLAMAPGLAAEVRETHSAVVVLIGTRAYKLKKAVDLGFLDFRSRAVRQAVCHREVELNSRLAPDVYLGVADVVGPDGGVCDHLVVMRRMPDDRRLSTLVAEGRPVEAGLDQVARLMAAFVERAASPPAAAVAAGRDALRARWVANLEVVDGAARASLLDPVPVARIGELAHRYLDGRARLFQQRIDGGRARDGHGDLLADDIFLLEDGPRVLDCIEFDDDLRYGDVLADMAFLAMDLERLGRPDLAGRFLRTYQELSGDTWPASLAHHHIAYRAGVRLKVACIRLHQGDASVASDARRLLGLTERHLDAGRVRLVLVGGLPATGKSTVAAGVADALGAVHLRSDVVRKELAGLAPDERAVAAVEAGIYDAATTGATYAALLDRARSLLELGESVVLDATWHDPAQRATASRLAADTAAELVQLRCVAPVEVVVARAASRLATEHDPSDATEDVVRAMAATDAPWPAAEPVDTSGSPAAAVTAAVAAAKQGGVPW